MTLRVERSLKMGGACARVFARDSKATVYTLVRRARSCDSAEACPESTSLPAKARVLVTVVLQHGIRPVDIVNRFSLPSVRGAARKRKSWTQSFVCVDTDQSDD